MVATRSQSRATSTVPIIPPVTVPSSASIISSSNRVMTRSMRHRAKVETWNAYTKQVLEQLENNKNTDGSVYSSKQRRRIWAKFVNYMMDELEQQIGNIENKTICLTNTYMVLCYMFQNRFNDFAESEDLKLWWDNTFAKEKTTLIDLEKNYNKGKITEETYIMCKTYVQRAQTYQIMYEKYVFPERAGAVINT